MLSTGDGLVTRHDYDHFYTDVSKSLETDYLILILSRSTRLPTYLDLQVKLKNIIL